MTKNRITIITENGIFSLFYLNVARTSQAGISARGLGHSLLCHRRRVKLYLPWSQHSEGMTGAAKLRYATKRTCRTIAISMVDDVTRPNSKTLRECRTAVRFATTGRRTLWVDKGPHGKLRAAMSSFLASSSPWSLCFGKRARGRTVNSC